MYSVTFEKSFAKVAFPYYTDVFDIFLTTRRLKNKSAVYPVQNKICLLNVVKKICILHTKGKTIDYELQNYELNDPVLGGGGCPASTFTPDRVCHRNDGAWLPHFGNSVSCYDYPYNGSKYTISTRGVISLFLRNQIRVEISLDKAIRMSNFRSGIVMAMNSSGNSASMIHPNGRVHQYGSRVEVVAYHDDGIHRYAKMWHKGVSFSTSNCPLVYLVDSGGTRTTSENFSDLSYDFTLDVFDSGFSNNLDFHKIRRAHSVMSEANFWLHDDGTENWGIHGIKVSQKFTGVTCISRNYTKFYLRTSPINGASMITTPFVHCTTSLDEKRHLFVRHGDRRLFYDGFNFIARNAGHSAGFDAHHQLTVF